MRDVVDVLHAETRRVRHGRHGQFLETESASAGLAVEVDVAVVVVRFFGAVADLVALLAAAVFDTMQQVAFPERGKRPGDRCSKS